MALRSRSEASFVVGIAVFDHGGKPVLPGSATSPVYFEMVMMIMMTMTMIMY